MVSDVPAVGPEPAAIEAAVGRLAVGVAVVTTVAAGAPHGCTGMAWAEGRDPLLMTVLRADGETRRLVEAAGLFAVSVLSADQSSLTWRFAQRPGAGDRFAGVPWSPGPAYGLPLLTGALAVFECTVRAIHPFGSHDIVVGRVASCATGGSASLGPAVHYDRRVRRLGEPQS